METVFNITGSIEIGSDKLNGSIHPNITDKNMLIFEYYSSRWSKFCERKANRKEIKYYKEYEKKFNNIINNLNDEIIKNNFKYINESEEDKYVIIEIGNYKAKINKTLGEVFFPFIKVYITDKNDNIKYVFHLKHLKNYKKLINEIGKEKFILEEYK